MARNANEQNLQQLVGESVMNAVNAASDGLKGDAYSDFDKAIEAAKGSDPFFNPTLSQYREGMVINTHREYVKMKKVNVGTSGSKAWVMTCPVGTQKADGTIEYTGAFNMYPSTLRKQIQVTDENGDQVLDANKQPVLITGAGNEVWDAARTCADEEALLNYAIDKVYKVSEIKRDFGPAVFVSQADGTRKATSHRLTSLPLFNVIG